MLNNLVNSDDISFEEAIKELECIVDKLENGELKLDDSLNYFQRGVELYKYCYQKLNDVDGKIKKILQNDDGKILEFDFEANI